LAWYFQPFFLSIVAMVCTEPFKILMSLMFKFNQVLLELKTGFMREMIERLALRGMGIRLRVNFEQLKLTIFGLMSFTPPRTLK
jgi:hypothetical protein